VVCDKKLVEYLPLYKGKNNETVTQFDMRQVEKIGLVKFNFLEFRCLTVINDALHLIKEQGKNDIDLLSLDYNDPATYKLLSSGDTTGIFQLESSEMKDLVIRLKPDCLNDLSALIAIYGPLDNGILDAYVERKHGCESVKYLFPELEDILKETYGLILYQEQIMRIANVIASYSMAEANVLRKAMGKKHVEELNRHWDVFLKNAVANNHPKNKVKTLFDLMQAHIGYAFIKSHSVAYAQISFQNAFLKAHYPVELMAARMTDNMDSMECLINLISECKANDIKLLPPDINESNKAFSVIKGDIRFGLMAVKNVKESSVDTILDVRKKSGPFSSIFEFCKRVNLKKVSKKGLKALITCGAFDSTGHNRNQMMIALDDAIEYGQKGLKNQTVNLPNVEEWDDKYRLALEKKTLGFYISDHPLYRCANLLKKYCDVNGITIHRITEPQTVRFGGIVTDVKIIRTKAGDQMAFISMEDLYGVVEVVIFVTVYESVRTLIVEDAVLIVEGEMINKKNGLKSLLAEKIAPLEHAVRDQDLWT
jgi:DNA polymerase-3 subunit alpha